jgi:hypothetical protein
MIKMKVYLEMILLVLDTPFEKEIDKERTKMNKILNTFKELKLD